MYCAECRGEFRPGITTCPTCNVALVEALPEELRPIGGDEPTQPVGVSGTRGLSRLVVVDGHSIDLMRAFIFEEAVELARTLEDVELAVRLKEVELDFPDKKQRFTVETRPEDHQRAEETLFLRWKRLAESEGTGAAGETAVDKCPACGSDVPLDVEECPDCGLVVGRGEDEEEEEEEGEAGGPA